MQTKSWFRFGAAALALATLACQRVDPAPTHGKLKLVPAPFEDAIPAEYGRLVGMSTGDPGWAGLYFEKPDQTLVVVWVDTLKGRIRDKVAVIPRR
jgi:hypothetical protein